MYKLSLTKKHMTRHHGEPGGSVEISAVCYAGHTGVRRREALHIAIFFFYLGMGAKKCSK